MHTNQIFKTLSIASLSIAVFNVHAAEVKLGINGSGELGFTDTTGNTTSTALFGALKLNYNQSDYEIKSKIETTYKSENDVQTEERYLIDIQGNRYYNAKRSYYSFVGARFEKNRFAGVELDSTLSLGLGKQIFKTEQTKLLGEAGLAQQNIDYTNEAGGGNDSQLAASFKLDLTHQINEQVTFLQDLTYLTGSEQTKFESNTGLKVKVADSMNLKASYKYRHNDSPAVGAKETDTQTLITLIYDF